MDGGNEASQKGDCQKAHKRGEAGHPWRGEVCSALSFFPSINWGRKVAASFPHFLCFCFLDD
jgi:hypothetical protein